MELTKEIKQFIESLPFGFTLWERRNGKLYSVYRTAASEKLIKIKRDEFLGKEFYECYPNAPANYKDRFFRVLDKGEVWKVDEFRFVAKNRKDLFRFTSFKVDKDVVGVIIEPVKKCMKIINDGTQCSNTSVIGNFCMKHALDQLRKKGI